MEMFRLFLILSVLVCMDLNGIKAVEFVLFTQPKTATHLLIPILSEMTKKSVYWAPEYRDTGSHQESFDAAFQNPQHFIFTLGRAPWTRQTMDLVWDATKEKHAFLHLHAPYSSAMENYLAEKEAINFFVKRDPRDQIVSLLNHYKYINFNDKEVERFLSDDDRLLFMIRKESRAQTVHYMNWLNSPVCCVLDFEKLMGTLGGVATPIDAMQEIKKVADTLQLNLSDEDLMNIYEKHLGSGWSFFKGKVGSWKDYFNEEHKLAIKEEIGDLLIQLGYEKDFNW